MKPTVVRIGSRIVAIRFQMPHKHAVYDYYKILESLPDDEATREWKAKKPVVRRLPGMVAEVRIFGSGNWPGEIVKSLASEGRYVNCVCKSSGKFLRVEGCEGHLWDM